MGCDLDAKADITATVLLFERNGRYYAFPTYYLVEAAVTDGRNSQYKGSFIENRIKVTKGNILDYGIIDHDILDALATYDVRDIGIDRWEATQLTQKLMTAGANVVEIMHTVAHLSEPTKELNAMTRGDRLRYDCPILLWMASNVVVREDTNENIRSNKMTPVAKIDGMIALILAIARMLVYKDGTSVYEERGLFTV